MNLLMVLGPAKQTFPAYCLPSRYIDYRTLPGMSRLVSPRRHLARGQTIFSNIFVLFVLEAIAGSGAVLCAGLDMVLVPTVGTYFVSVYLSLCYILIRDVMVLLMHNRSSHYSTVSST
jgi:hypothetical protein